MNREQADKIISVIERDATGKKGFFPTEDTECVLGGLWLAMGGARNVDTIDSGKMRTFYGLSSWYQSPSGYYDQWMKLADINDYHSILTERRAALIDLVNSWVEGE